MLLLSFSCLNSCLTVFYSVKAAGSEDSLFGWLPWNLMSPDEWPYLWHSTVNDSNTAKIQQLQPKTFCFVRLNSETPGLVYMLKKQLNDCLTTIRATSVILKMMDRLWCAYFPKPYLKSDSFPLRYLACYTEHSLVLDSGWPKWTPAELLTLFPSCCEYTVRERKERANT